MTIATTSIHDIHSTAWSAISLNEGARGYTDLVDIFQNTGLEVCAVPIGGFVTVSWSQQSYCAFVVWSLCKRW
jgi:hypothetical protein